MLWQKLLGTNAAAGIEYVGGTTGTTLGGVDDWTVSLTSLSGGLATSPSIGDLVVVYYGIGATSSALSPSVASAGYTLIATRGANDDNDANLGVSYKVLSTAETTVDLVSTGLAGRGGAVAIYVLRGVENKYSNFFNVITASGANSVLCDPPAITPTTQGSVILAGGVGAHARGAATFSSSDLTSFISAGVNATGVDATIGLGYVDWTSGEFDPAAFTFSSSNSTAYSWAAATMSLLPNGASTTQIGPFPVASAYDLNLSNGTIVQVDKPAGTREGDLMIAVLASNTTSASTWTNFSGWTELVDLGSPPSLLVAYKIATAGEASSYSFTNTVSARLAASIVTYRNAAYDNIGSTRTNSALAFIPSVFVGADYSRVIAAVSRGAGGAIIEPSTMQEAFYINGSTTPSIMVAQDTKLAIYGESGQRIFNLQTGANNAGVLVSIQPAASYTPYASFIAEEANSGSSATSTAITIPAGTVPGSIMLMLVQATAATTAPTITTPTGWSVEDTSTFTDAGFGFTVALYKRVADGSEAATVTLLFSAASTWVSSIASCGGADEDIVYSRNYQSSTSTATGTSITATTNGLLLYMSTTANTADTGSRTFGTVSGMTERLDTGVSNNIDPRIGISSQEGLTAGSTGDKSSTLSGSVTSATTYLICVPAK